MTEIINHREFKMLILASASPRRTLLLKQWGISHHIKPSEVVELTQEKTPYFTAIELAQANAFLKAKSVSKTYPNQWVLGVDTIVVYDNKIFGKPRDLHDAKIILQTLNGKTHQVVSGLALVKNKRTHFFSRICFDISHVTFRTLSLKQIEAYLKQVPVLDKAGAYAVQEKGDWLIQSIKGSQSNVMGLPKAETLKLLKVIYE